MTDYKFNIGDEVEVYNGWELPLIKGTIYNRRSFSSRNFTSVRYVVLSWDNKQTIHSEEEIQGISDVV